MTKILSALFASFLVALCPGCSTLSRAEAEKMTVLSYNIHHGAGADGKLDLERIAQIIREQPADLVALQEVDVKTSRSGGVDQAAELGQLTGMHAVFGKAMDYSGGAYGQAILSRWPIKVHAVHQLPQRAGREPRIILVARIDNPNGNFHFASTHLDHEIPEVRVEQAEAINRILIRKERRLPVILAGDFNAVPESDPMKALFKSWMDTAGDAAAPTIPARSPRRRIDYILAAPQDEGVWKTVRSEVLNEPIASDHRPVKAILELVRK
jgi:endonuclease/exonuclease/phosphatase family metal-dependent hydrolase